MEIIQPNAMFMSNKISQVNQSTESTGHIAGNTYYSHKDSLQSQACRNRNSHHITKQQNGEVSVSLL